MKEPERAKNKIQRVVNAWKASNTVTSRSRSRFVLIYFSLCGGGKEDGLLSSTPKLVDGGRARGPICNHGDAKLLVARWGHLRTAHQDNELRCNPNLRWSAVYPSRSPSLSLSRQSSLRLTRLRSLWSSAYLLPTSSSLISNSPSVGMQLSTFTKLLYLETMSGY